MGDNRWPKIAYNYKPTGQRVTGISRRRWVEDFEAGTGIELSNP
jgi:hypothetical protein